MTKIFVIVGIFLLLAGCSLQNDNPPSPIDETPPEIVEEGLGFIIANRVNIRDRGDIVGAKIDSLEIGIEVKILSQSENKQAIGNYEDYWYQIEYGEKTGWCFGEYISSAKDLNIKLEERLSNYFNDKSITISEAINTVKTYGEIGGEKQIIDEGVRKIILIQEEKEHEYISKISQGNIKKLLGYKIEDLNNPETIKDNVIKEIILNIKNDGYFIDISEGMPFLASDPDFILNIFKDRITEGMREYLTLQSTEVKKRIFEDGGLTASPDELADRIAKWDIYISKYSENKEAEVAVNNYYNRYLFFYMNGIDNTAFYDRKTNILKEDVKKSYERFLIEYKNTKAFEVINSYYELLVVNEFKKTDEVKNYINKYTIFK